MKHFMRILIISLLCIIGLSACDSPVLDLDKYHRNAKQAVEALFNELPNKSDKKFLKEAVKFKENDKLSDYQKNEFFKQLTEKKFKVTAKKVKIRDGYTEVVCDITLRKKKFRLYKEDNVWKTQIGFAELRDAIYK